MKEITIKIMPVDVERIKQYKGSKFSQAIGAYENLSEDRELELKIEEIIWEFFK